jgi:hypothetical protein
MSTELRVDVIPSSAQGTFAIYEASLGLSATNHRLYRQFRTYNMKVKLTAPYHAGVEIYVLKDTWMVRNAIKKAAKVYYNTHVLAPGQEEKPARWHDFRIRPVNSGATIGRLNPTGFQLDGSVSGLSYNVTSSGQYDMSDIRSQSSGSSFTMCIGDIGNSNQIDIISEYMNSDDTTSDEANASAIYGQFLSSSTPQSDTDDEGDLAPYNMTNLDNYLVKIDTIHSGKTTTATFDAPLGWIFFRHNANIRPSATDVLFGDSGNFQVIDSDGGTTACLQVIHSAGKYKGVRSEPMGKVIKINQKEYDVK